MAWQALVEIDARDPVPGGRLRELLEAHPRVVSLSVNAPAGRRLLGRARPASALVGVEAETREEAERVARAAVEDALARAGVRASLRVGAFRGR